MHFYAVYAIMIIIIIHDFSLTRRCWVFLKYKYCICHFVHLLFNPILQKLQTLSSKIIWLINELLEHKLVKASVQVLCACVLLYT